jgi:putative membrane protein
MTTSATRDTGPTATDVVHDRAGDAATTTHNGLVWNRLHFATPFARAWSTFLAILVAGGYMGLDVFNGVANLEWLRRFWFLAFGAFILLAAALVGYMFIAWRKTAYALGADAVHFRQGVLFRAQRQAQLDRIQAIDVRRPLVARLLGLSELNIEVAGGADSQVKIGFLHDDDARALRSEILTRAAGLRGATGRPMAERGVDDSVNSESLVALDSELQGHDRGGPAGDSTSVASLSGLEPAFSSVAGSPTHASTSSSQGDVLTTGLPLGRDDDETPVVAVPVVRMIGSMVLSMSMLFGALVVIAFLAAAIVGLAHSGDGLIQFLRYMVGGAFAVVLGIGTTLWSRINGEFNFRSAISRDGIRIHRGLTQTMSQTIPPGRVQAVQIQQPVLWRSKDWWRVRITVAGYKVEGEAGSLSQSVLLPVGTRAEAYRALWLVLPDLGVEDPISFLDAALTGTTSKAFTSADGFVGAPRRSWMYNLWARRRVGVATTSRVIVFRDGRLARKAVFVPHERGQSVCVSQGPVARLLRLASVRVHLPAGMIVPWLWGLDESDAGRIVEEAARLARVARAKQSPEQWLETVASGVSAAL